MFFENKPVDISADGVDPAGLRDQQIKGGAM
jgi:hypothetical protein